MTLPADVSPEAAAKLQRFVELLLRWNARVNLVAAGDTTAIWQRHVEDSLQLIPLLPPGVTRGADLGSGAGFPGLVLALATGIPFDLIEADRQKAAFLRTAAQETAAPVTVHACRIEAASLAPVPLVTARALAPLPQLLRYAAPLLTPGGVCLFLKGSGVDAELAAAADAWDMAVERFPSRTAPGGEILRLRITPPACGRGRVA
jgi:16S rRNA (guanine527-N7)-methyltransferase